MLPGAPVPDGRTIRQRVGGDDGTGDIMPVTNALESVHARLRKIIKTRGHFPNDDAATKLIWLALRNITAGWGKAANYWRLAMNQFAILYEDRFTVPRT
jgi:putative transposase